jgi:glycosyltransferase involved in cell wall biosynthesis
LTNAIAALAAGWRVDLLHAYLGMPGVAAVAAGRRLSLPVVVTFDSGEFVAFEDIRYGLQRRWIDRRAIAGALRAAARVTVTTEGMKRSAAALVNGRRVDVVPIGVDPRAFPPADRPSGPPWRLLRVASINAVKDYPTLLRAFAHVAARGLDVRLDVVGEDTMGGAAQALTRMLDLDSRVTFHGFQPTDRLAPFYASAHLHLVPSRHEASGVAILEAAATGLVTVGTAVGYVADWHPDRAVGVPVNDPNALASAVIDLLQDRSRRARLASAARDWTLAHDADWTAQQFERIYGEVQRIVAVRL